MNNFLPVYAPRLESSSTRVKKSTFDLDKFWVQLHFRTDNGIYLAQYVYVRVLSISHKQLRRKFPILISEVDRQLYLVEKCAFLGNIFFFFFFFSSNVLLNHKENICMRSSYNNNLLVHLRQAPKLNCNWKRWAFFFYIFSNLVSPSLKPEPDNMSPEFPSESTLEQHKIALPSQETLRNRNSRQKIGFRTRLITYLDMCAEKDSFFWSF